MIITLTYMLITLAMMSIMMTHPVSMTMIIIVQTIIVALMIITSQASPWFGYLLFLVFLGGMLILFSYITSLASNFMFKFNTSMLIPMILAVPIMKISLTNNTAHTPQNNIIKNISYFYFQNTPTTLMMIMYLLMVLLVVVNITHMPSGPLQQKKT